MASLYSLSYLWYSATAVATTFVVGAVFSFILGKLYSITVLYCTTALMVNVGTKLSGYGYPKTALIFKF